MARVFWLPADRNWPMGTTKRRTALFALSISLWACQGIREPEVYRVGGLEARIGLLSSPNNLGYITVTRCGRQEKFPSVKGRTVYEEGLSNVSQMSLKQQAWQIGDLLQVTSPCRTKSAWYSLKTFSSWGRLSIKRPCRLE